MTSILGLGNMKVLKKIVFFPITKWHLYGMLSYLMEMYGESEIVRLEIEVYAIKHSDGLYQLNENDMPYSNMIFHKEDELQLSNKCLIKMPMLFLNKKRKRDEILFMFANSILVRKMLTVVSISNFVNSKIRVILVDDGIGSYLSNQVWEKCAEVEGGFGFTSRVKGSIARFLSRKTGALEWHMFSIRDGSLQKNHTHGCMKVIKNDIERNFLHELEQFKMNYYEKPIAIIITQPWSETGQIEEDEEKIIIENVVESLNKNYQVLIKTHPREKELKYCYKNAAVLSGKYPAEFLFCVLRKEDIIVGFNSTALVNAALIFGLKTYSIGNLVATGKKNNMMDIACSEFLKLTSNIIQTYKIS